jgi:hypothetical protein
MAPPSEKPLAVADWLGKQLGAERTRIVDDFDREVVVVCCHKPGSDAAELELSYEALESFDVSQILHDLEGDGIQERLSRDPSVRLQYGTDRRLHHFETRLIQCDGKSYRVVRDAEHNVFIFDNKGKPLASIPAGPLVMGVSIYQKDVSRWCEDVRKWRGSGQ